VAEGIETGAELAAVRAAGVTRGQGYGLARPQSLPLAKLDYQPVPFLDLVAGSASGGVLTTGVAEALAIDPAQAAHRMRAVVAAMANSISLLRRSDGNLGVDEFRALCGSLARQVEGLDADLADLIRFSSVTESSSVD
jgi:hypothetical protein